MTCSRARLSAAAVAILLASSVSSGCGARSGLLGGSDREDPGPAAPDGGQHDDGGRSEVDSGVPRRDAAPPPPADSGARLDASGDAADAGDADADAGVVYCSPPIPQGGVTTIVDGFHVTFLPLPTSAVTSGLTPTSLSSGVHFTESTTNPWGATNPFQYSPTLDGSEYDAVWDGEATYDYATPMATFAILWGTIDDSNALRLVDASGAPLGTLTGTDLSAAAASALEAGYNWGDGVNILVTADRPFFTAVTVGGSDLTFEYSNVAVTPMVTCPP